MKIVILIGLASFFVQLIGYMIPSTKSKFSNIILGIIFSVLILGGVYFVVEKFKIGDYFLFIAGSSFVASFLLALVFQKGKEEEKEGDIKAFILKGARGFKLAMYDPFVHFLIIAGTKGGKTASLGKPLLEEFVKNNFAMFVYDLKDGDYTKTAYYLTQKHDYKYSFYPVSFTDLSQTYRFNPWKPEVVGTDVQLVQLAVDLVDTFKNAKGDTKSNEFYDAGLGVLKGVAVRFFNDFPEYCTIPHIYMFLVHNADNPKKVTAFLNGHPQSRAYAISYIASSDTPKLQASYITSLTTYVSDLSANKDICYVLSGDDFNFNLIEPENPKLIAISNNYQMMDTLSPIIASLFTISSRHITMKNKINTAYVMDEATTFKIKGFETMISILREYKVSFVFITQSLSKISMVYGKDVLGSFVANFDYRFFGRTGDVDTQKRFVQMFKKVDHKIETKSSNNNMLSGGLSKGKSERVDRKDKYEGADWSTLKSGEFIGLSSSANHTEFKTRFQLFEQPNDIELPIVKVVTQEMVDKNYQNIIDRVKTIE